MRQFTGRYHRDNTEWMGVRKLKVNVPLATFCFLKTIQNIFKISVNVTVSCGTLTGQSRIVLRKSVMANLASLVVIWIS